MALILDKSPTYKWPVRIETTSEDGRKLREDFTAIFRRTSDERVGELVKEAQETDERGRSDMEFIKEILDGWEDVKDAKDKPVEFCDSALKALLSINGAGRAIVEAFLESINLGKQKRKTSGGLRST